MDAIRSPFHMEGSPVIIDRSSPFNPKEFLCPNFRKVRRRYTACENVPAIEPNRLRLAQPYWKEHPPTACMRLDAYVFRALWHAREVSLFSVVRQMIPGTNASFQFFLDGTTFENEYGVMYVPYFRIGPDLFAVKYGVEPETKLFWGMSPIKYDWGWNVPALVLDPY